jgi:hypothetical protein
MVAFCELFLRPFPARILTQVAESEDPIFEVVPDALDHSIDLVDVGQWSPPAGSVARIDLRRIDLRIWITVFPVNQLVVGIPDQM